jgi:hypothetical protein
MALTLMFIIVIGVRGRPLQWDACERMQFWDLSWCKIFKKKAVSKPKIPLLSPQIVANCRSVNHMWVVNYTYSQGGTRLNPLSSFSFGRDYELHTGRSFKGLRS